MTSFHLHHEKWLGVLANMISSNQYKPLPSKIFIVTSPKPREVIAAHILDRVVHHYICSYLEPYWEKRFDWRSYACRPGKGALNAVEGLSSYARGHLARQKTPLWYLKVDVKAFFPSIDKKILETILAPHIKCPLIKELTLQTLWHDPTLSGNFRLMSSPRLYNLLPPHKSLFKVAKGKGLPIGNLSSQFFANVYMNRCDQYLARRCEIKPLYWQRYVDDIVMLDTCPKKLSRLACLVNSFLHEELSLELHPSKTIIQPLARGLDHLGYFILPNRMYARRRVLKNIKNKINLWALGPSEDLQSFANSMNSYLGHLSHCDGFRIKQDICKTASSLAPNADLIVSKDFRSLVNKQTRIERSLVLHRTLEDMTL